MTRTRGAVCRTVGRSRASSRQPAPVEPRSAPRPSGRSRRTARPRRAARPAAPAPPGCAGTAPAARPADRPRRPTARPDRDPGPARTPPPGCRSPPGRHRAARPLLFAWQEARWFFDKLTTGRALPVTAAGLVCFAGSASSVFTRPFALSEPLLRRGGNRPAATSGWAIAGLTPSWSTPTCPSPTRRRRPRRCGSVGVVADPGAGAFAAVPVAAVQRVSRRVGKTPSETRRPVNSRMRGWGRVREPPAPRQSVSGGGEADVAIATTAPWDWLAAGRSREHYAQ